MASNSFKRDSFNSLGRQKQRQQAVKQGRDTAGLPMMKMTQKAFIPSVPPTRSKGLTVSPYLRASFVLSAIINSTPR